MKCPRCQHENRAKAKFCEECGTPLERLDGSAQPASSFVDVQRSLTEALEQQTATSEILRAISGSPTDLQRVLDAVAERAARLCHASDGSIFRLEGEALLLVAHHVSLPAGPIGRFTLPVVRGTVGGRAVLERRTIHVRDLQQESEDFPEGSSFARRFGHRTILGVPLLREGVPIGCIQIRRAEVEPFTEKQVQLLQTFADQAVIAIENVRLFTELQEKNTALTQAHTQVTEALEQQTALGEILRVISQSPTDVQPVFDAIVRSAAALCHAPDVIISMAEGNMLHLAASVGTVAAAVWQSEIVQGGRLPLTRGSVSGRAFIDRCTVHVHDVSAASDDDFPEGKALQRAYGGRGTTLSVPLLRDSVSLGVITLVKDEVSPFTERQIALLQSFADQAVIAIENVRLFNETKEALEQQTATSEILRVISSSPTNLQPVLDAVAERAARLCSADDVKIHLVDGEMLRLAARLGPIPSVEARPLIPTRHIGRAVLERRTIHVHDMQIALDEFPDAAGDVRTFGARTALATPLLREGVAIGVIQIRRLEVEPFSEKQIALLETFADQAVIAIENVRLFTELQEKNQALTNAHAQVTEALEQQTATSEILRVLSSSPTNIQPVFDTIAKSAMRLCGGNFGNAATYDGDLLHLVAHANVTAEGVELTKQMFPMRPSRATVLGRVVLERAVVHIPDARADVEYLQTLRVALRGGSAIGVPVLRGDEVIGSIAVGRSEPRPFTESEIALLKTFADQAVIAIENVRLFTELEARTGELTRSVGELRALGEVSQALSSTLDVDVVLDTIVARANDLIGADGCTIFEYDEVAEQFHLRATRNLEPRLVELARGTPLRKGDQGILGQLPRGREAVQVPDITAGSYSSPISDALIEAGYRAVVAVPLIREDHLIGALTMNRKTPGEFPAETIALLQTFATQSALAIQNARLFREIEMKSRELEAASRHKSEFLANMSHELRTPLNAVIGFSEVLTERMFGDLNEKQEEYLKDIHASGQHLLSLINDILDLSKIEAGKMDLELSEFDLPMTIDNALMLVRERAARRAIELHKSVDERLGQVQADERKIRQVLLNLLSNAIKFTPEGGRIEVGAKRVNGSIEVSVSDTGVGIAPEDQEAVFEEFRQVGTAEKKVEGTGLGLALSRKFIELHGGKIRVESQVGEGSTFTFTVPVRRGE